MDPNVAVISGTCLIIAAIIKFLPTNHGKSNYVSKETWDEFRLSLETRLSGLEAAVRDLQTLIRERL